MLNKIIIAIVLANTQLYASKLTYLSRFTELAKHGAAKGFNAAGEQKRLEIMLQKYPWLESLPQPSLEVRLKESHYQTPNHGIKGLPHEFISDKQLVYHYPDGNKAMLAYVSEKTEHYESFLERNKGIDVASQVLIYKKDNSIAGRFLHIERPHSFMKNVFGQHDYDFEGFLDGVNDTVLNLSSGGYRLARDIARITSHKLTAFSADIVGHEGVYYELPYYLFADSMNTPLPSDTFGAVIQFGGYLAKAETKYIGLVEALDEMARLAKPGGYLLFETSHPVTPEWIDDAAQNLSKAVEYTEFYPSLHWNSHGWRTDYLVEIKFLDD